jgi:hypothetical protein
MYKKLLIGLWGKPGAAKLLGLWNSIVFGSADTGTSRGARSAAGTMKAEFDEVLDAFDDVGSDSDEVTPVVPPTITPLSAALSLSTPDRVLMPPGPPVQMPAAETMHSRNADTPVTAPNPVTIEPLSSLTSLSITTLPGDNLAITTEDVEVMIPGTVATPTVQGGATQGKGSRGRVRKASATTERATHASANAKK